MRVSPYTGYLIETFVTLAAVCGLAVVVLWTARRMGVARSNGPIELRGYLPLDARRAIVLVKVGATVFIVGVGEGGFTKLGEMADADLPASPQARGLTFAQVFAFARMRRSADASGVEGGSVDRGGQGSASAPPAPRDGPIGDPAGEA